MTDVDPLLELFVLDVLDVRAWPFTDDGEAWGCGLPLVDITAAGRFDRQSVFAGGGFPKVWENLNDIIGGAGDLLSKLRDLLNDLWGAIWTGIGGAIRWLWDVVSYSFTAVYKTVKDVGDFVIHGIGDSIKWLSGVVGSARDAIYTHVQDAAGWVRDRVTDIVGGARDALLFGVHIVAGRVEDLFTWTKDLIVWIVGNVAGRVENLFTYVGQQVSDAAKWSVDNIVGPVFAGFQDIGGAFKNGFESLVKKLEEGARAVGEAIQGAFGWVVEHSLEPFGEFLSTKLSIPLRFIRGEFQTPSDFFDAVLDPPREVITNLAAAPIWATLAIISVLMAFSPMLTPVTSTMTQAFRRVHPDALLSRSDLSTARWLGLNVDIEDQLALAGYADWQRSAIAEMDKRIPGPGDLLSMAGHRAFSPEEAAARGYVTPLPPGYAEWMSKIGYGPEWADRYWWSHWELPGMSEMFDMYHRLRDDVTIEDVKGLLAARAIPPVWHDRFIRIGYSPLARVDVRRMYKAGVMTEDQVYGAHLDLGYAPDTARMLTEFTKKWAFPGDVLQQMADMSATTIRDGYRRGVLSREEAASYMVDAGYDPTVADFLLRLDDVALAKNPAMAADVNVQNLTESMALEAYRTGVWDSGRTQTELMDMGYLPGTAELLVRIEDAKTQASITDVKVKIIQARYKAFELDDAGAASELRALGIIPERQELLLLTWEGERHTSNRKLTPAQVLQAVKAGLYTDEEGLNYVIGLGYSPDDANVYMGIQGRVLTDSQIIAAWKRGVLSEGDARAGLERLGYSPADAQTLMGIAATPLSQSQVVQAWRIGKLTEADALKRLEQLGLTEQDARTVLGLAPLTLTSSQVVAAWRSGLLADAAALKRLQELGYSVGDATILLGLAPLPLNVSQVMTARKDGLLSDSDTLLRLEVLGYTPADAELLLATQTVPLTSSEVVGAWRSGLLTDAAALAQLAAIGYSAENASILMGLAPLPLNVSQIMTAWKQGLIGDDEALGRLEQLGYTSGDAALLLVMQEPPPAA